MINPAPRPSEVLMPGVLEDPKSLFPYTLETKGVLDGVSFPSVSWHAFAGRNSFAFDDFFDGSSKGVHNQLLGPGLYCGDRSLADLYADRFKREGRDKYGVEKILANGAILLHIDDPRALEPLTPEQRESALRYIDAKRSAGSEDDSGLNAFEGYIRGHSSREPRMYDLALGDGYFPAHRIGMAVPTRLRQGWLMSIGVDGAVKKIHPSVDPNRSHNVVAYWRRDSVGDERSWGRRFERLNESQGFFYELGRIASVEEADIDILELYDGPSRVEDPLAKPKNLNKAETDSIVRFLQSERDIITATQGDELVSMLSMSRINTFDVMRRFASMSPIINRLMSADVGVWEGYRLHEHTQAVMNIFESNWAGNINDGSDGVKRGIMLMRLMLLIHDMGKPLAVANEGHKGNQGAYNNLVSDKILSNIPLPQGSKDLIKDIVGNDVMGSLLKRGNQSAVESTAQRIASMIKKHSRTIGPDDLFQMIFLEHEVDAASYTDQAYYFDSVGKKHFCKPGLNGVFKLSDAVRRHVHSRRNLSLIDALTKRVNELI
ncbi:hypothetical protein KDA00_02415 [Candidatus Saccharibacteria bacterium]|nr:hypothetical protein [Candidatus Saccharibacteria bacterium]